MLHDAARFYLAARSFSAVVAALRRRYYPLPQRARARSRLVILNVASPRLARIAAPLIAYAAAMSRQNSVRAAIFRANI